MDSFFNKFAQEYALAADKQIYSGDDQRTAYNPVVFLFIGDRCTDAIREIHGEINKKWGNSKGVLYMQVYSQKEYKSDNVFNFRIVPPTEDKKLYRKQLYDHLYQDEELLVVLNQVIRQLRTRILEYGKLYAYLEKINISVVTRADDPLNVLVPEIVLLLRTKLAEHFKMLNTDLYTLFVEKDSDEDFGYSSSVAMSFFRETEYFQSRDYSYSHELEVLKEGVRLPVSWKNPIFDLVYLLGDKNEKGILMENALKRNCEIITCISLLKNRSITTSSYEEKNELYNNTQFRANISYYTDRCCYATAGIATVKRPNQAIAMAVLYHFQKMLQERLRRNKTDNIRELAKLLGLDDSTLRSTVLQYVRGDGYVDEMMALMTMDVPLEQLDRMNLKEAEAALFGDTAQSFFEMNFRRKSWSEAIEASIAEELKSSLNKKIAEGKEFSLYDLAFWTSEEGVIGYLRELARDTASLQEDAAGELEDIYAMGVQQLPVKRILQSRKSIARNIKELVIENIFGEKLFILELEVKQKLLRTWERALHELHEEAAQLLGQYAELEETLSRCLVYSIEQADRYVGQNIREYYENVVRDTLREFEDKWGERFYQEERFFGNITLTMRKGAEAFSQRLAEICGQHILSNQRFFQPFEVELHHRANVTAEYGREDVLSREELFKTLYNILEKNSAVSIYINNFTATQRYEEKYFFGDYYSDFMQFAFKNDEDSRTYRLGCVNEKRTSGIDKLNLMGGFTLEDLVYGKNCMKYYESYIRQGYTLHGIDTGLLRNIQYNL